jgi:predicted transcriptional regulator
MQQQLKLPMLTHYDGPAFVDQELVRACRSYREAVKMCWNLRTRRNLTQRLLAEETGLYASHVSDYISGDDKARRQLPAESINPVEISCGNRFITQWLNLQAQVTVLEQLLEGQRRTA